MYSSMLPARRRHRASERQLEAAAGFVATDRQVTRLGEGPGGDDEQSGKDDGRGWTHGGNDAAGVGVNAAGYSNTRELGLLLYSEYLYPIEVAAVILLVAMIAAIALTLRQRKDSKAIDPGDAVRVAPGAYSEPADVAALLEALRAATT